MGLVVGSNPMSMDAIAALLVERFGADLEDVRIQEPDTVVARCAREQLKDVAARLKADADVGYETLNWIAGVDRRTAFESVYHVYSWKTNTYLELHVDLPRAKAGGRHASPTSGRPRTGTSARPGTWSASCFVGHPDLRRILLKDDFVGHPLRKDYVDLAENHPHV